jgi:hypothetical protein
MIKPFGVSSNTISHRTLLFVPQSGFIVLVASRTGADGLRQTDIAFSSLDAWPAALF